MLSLKKKPSLNFLSRMTNDREDNAMKNIKKIIALLLAVAMLLLSACGSENITENENSDYVTYNTPAGFAKKSETVYVNLDSKGNPLQTIVSDWIHTTQSEVYVDDKTNLSEIVNVKDDSKYEVDGQNIRWHMKSTDLYYQGKSTQTLPVNFKIQYSLDGKSIEPSVLLGKSGNVQIKITMTNTDSYQAKVNGQTVTMYNPLAIVGGVMLSENKFSNITIKNGQLVGTGNTQYAMLAGFPGLRESLGVTQNSTEGENVFTLDNEFIITADVTEFELGNFMFAGLPVSSLGIGLNSVTNSMDDVRDNLAKLQSVQASLQSMNLDSVINAMTTDSNKLANLSALVTQASSIYQSNQALLNVIDKYTTADNLAAIQTLSDYISTADFTGLEDALTVINSIFGNEESAAIISDGMSVLKQMSADLSDPQVQQAINNLPQTVNTLSQLQSAINENRTLIEALKSLSDTSALSNLTSTVNDLKSSLAADSMLSIFNADGNSDEVAARMTAWFKIGTGYTIFTKKADTMNSSVVFVFKTDSIKKGVQSAVDDEDYESANNDSSSKGFLDKILDLFR